MKYLLLSLFAVGQLLADVDVGKYRRIHSRTWEQPKMICTHAAVAVLDAARRDGLPATVIRFELPPGKKYRFHAVPTIFANGRWHVIDSMYRDRRWIALSRAVDSIADLQDPVKNGRLTGRVFVRWYDYPSPSLLQKWRNQLSTRDP